MSLKRKEIVKENKLEEVCPNIRWVTHMMESRDGRGMGGGGERADVEERMLKMSLEMVDILLTEIFKSDTSEYPPGNDHLHIRYIPTNPPQHSNSNPKPTIENLRCDPINTARVSLAGKKLR